MARPGAALLGEMAYTMQEPMMKPAWAAPAKPMLHVLELPPFVDALPLPENASLVHSAKAKRLQVRMREIHASVHRDLPPTRMWSYGDTALAPLIEARAHEPLEIEWLNHLPERHFLPVDHSLHGCGRELPEVRAIAHVHGARVPRKDDGYPDDWFAPGKSLTCHYPLKQDATALWYHDHAMGLSRLNVYAGLFGMFLIRDEAEDRLGLPSGKYEVPLILYDRDFSNDGQFFYPTSGDPEHPWVSEFAGDAILINGKIRPYFEIEPRLYRFRMVNVANSRFFRLSVAETGRAAVAMPLRVIGGDQGLLETPAEMKVVTFAPGERVDVLVDFSGAAGKKVYLRNGALEVMEFRVGSSGAEAGKVPAALRKMDRLEESSAVKTRTVTLNEYRDKVGNSMVMLLNRMHWHEPVTEKPRLNTTEIWEFVNMTEDVHPMHLHLVRFQILDRRTFDTFEYLMHKKLIFTGDAVKPEAWESGWKDVVQCSAGVITRVLIRFEGYTGKYLYHCHILEHEANDMMRPFEVVA